MPVEDDDIEPYQWIDDPSLFLDPESLEDGSDEVSCENEEDEPWRLDQDEYDMDHYDGRGRL